MTRLEAALRDEEAQSRLTVLRYVSHADSEAAIVEPMPGVHVAVIFRPANPRTFSVELLDQSEKAAFHSLRELMDWLGSLLPPVTYPLDCTQDWS